MPEPSGRTSRMYWRGHNKSIQPIVYMQLIKSFIFQKSEGIDAPSWTTLALICYSKFLYSSPEILLTATSSVVLVAIGTLFYRINII